VGPDTIRVVDTQTNALVVTALVAQVTAIPETYRGLVARAEHGLIDVDDARPGHARSRYATTEHRMS
jgi:hypothetical protein